MRRTSLSYSKPRNGIQGTRDFFFVAPMLFSRKDTRVQRMFGILQGRLRETYETYRHLQSEMLFEHITKKHTNMNLQL